MRRVKLPDEIREFFRKQGRIGAAKRHAGMSPERRREVARLAAETRWSKKKPVSKDVPRSAKNGAVPKTTKKSRPSGGTK